MRIKYNKEVYILLSAIIFIYIWSLFLDYEVIRQLFWLTTLILIFPIITLLRGFYGLSAERSIVGKKRFFAGDDMEIKVKLKNKIYIPIFLPEIVDSLPLSYKLRHNEKNDVKAVLPLVAKEKSLKYCLYNIPRGQLLFSDINISKKDLFGFVEMKKHIKRTESVLVYPKYTIVNPESIVGIRQQCQGEKKQYKKQDTSQITGLREYQHGDKLSLVHWKASAKNNILMSKEFTPKLSRKSYLILDCFKGVGNEKDSIDLFELSVSVAASITYAFGNSNEPFSLLMNNNYRWEVDKRKPGQFLSQAMRKLAFVQKDGSVPIEVFCDKNSFRFEKGTNVIIVSESFDTKLRKVIAKLLNKKVLVKVFIIGDKKGVNLPFVKNISSLEELHKGSRRGMNVENKV
ncbi:DUF58 domain-containing protein [Proteinivorax tanatarense]|uniref:DUF58 domain-containing protein n=1 Tax=Proteinivorax tanatarense TaxID=1260629 RepID=A0AAU7VQU8_9FIRM